MLQPEHSIQRAAVQRTVPVEEALDHLSGLLDVIDGPATRSDRRRVERIELLRRSDLPATRAGDDLPTDLDSILYFVDFADAQGSAILGADSRLPAVVAVTESSIDWKRKLIDFDITQVGTGPVDTVGRMIVSLVKNYIDLKVSSRGYRSWYKEWEEYVPPMMRTKWTQYSPYNDYCYNSDGKRALAGCGPIAIGQVFAFNRWPKYINGQRIDWSLIEQFNYDYSSSRSNEARKEIANFIHNIGIGVSATYGVNGTFSGLSSQEDFFKQCGYVSVRTEPYNDENIDEMIFSVQRPVIILGYADHEDGIRKVSHFWVIDGGLKRYYTLCTQISYAGRIFEYSADQKEFIVHCNFGWGGLYDGYYHSEIFDLSKPAADYDDDLSESIPSAPPYYVFDQNLYLTMYSDFNSNN